VPSHPTEQSQETEGYPALLNLSAQPHWTVFVSDFALPSHDVRRLKRQLENVPTRALFVRLDRGLNELNRTLRSANINLRDDYISFQALTFQHSNSLQVTRLLGSPRRDLAKLELPLPESRFHPSHASHLLRIVMKADYREQELIAHRFFDLLSRRKPYTVKAETADGTLLVNDERPWYDFSGRLREGEMRILPAGEVSYAGNHVEGDFTVDGAILPFPEHPELAAYASRLGRLSRTMRRRPLQLKIRRGKVIDVGGKGDAPRAFRRLFEKDERYRRVVEVGISFNSASRRFIHSWPAASNEVHPGVHLGIGGDPSRNDDGYERAARLIHIDLIAVNCRVDVNGQGFLRFHS